VRSLALPQQEPNLPPHLAELGAKTYAANCAQCHGPRGDGNGSAAGQLIVPPASFRSQRPSVAHAIEVLRNGIEGTPMAPWTSRLTNAELLAVADYVRGFYAGALEGSQP
jgi:high-affinity iron transporter